MNDTQKILDAIKELQEGQKRLEQGQTELQQGQKNLERGQAQLHTTVAQNTTMIEALKDGQESSTALIRVDIQDLATKIAKNKKETNIRLDALEEYTGFPNPLKH